MKRGKKMNLLLKIFLSHCWTNIYLIIGISLGLSLSMLTIRVGVDDYEAKTEHFLQYPNYQDLDEYEPKININHKPQQAQKVSKTLIRPRYYSTELGIREKLFIGVITSHEYLYSRDIAINKTIAHVVDKVRYFISIPEGTKPNVTIPGIVGFTDTRSILKPFHTMKYIIDNYLENYDYYFLTKDVSYINVKELVKFVNKISVSQNVHVGVLGEASYCSLVSGVLLSNSIVQELKSNLDWCVKNAYSDSDDVNFGRCLAHATATRCSDQIQGQQFTHTKLKSTFFFEKDLKSLIDTKDFLKSLVIYPIYDHRLIYKFNTYFTAMNSMRTQQEIFKIREAILDMAPLGPSEKKNTSWPIGNQPGNKANGRFDILRWMYFNETHAFFNTDVSTVQELKANEKSDIHRVINSTISNVVYQNGMLKFNKLINGYRKYDASRGMDYIFDLEFINVETGKLVKKRMEVCKPLGKVEILPVPYVTENTRVNIILIIDSTKKQEALNFLEQYATDCMEKKYKTFLMVALLYDSNSISKGPEDVYYEIKQRALSLAEKYKKQQAKITWLSIRLPENVTNVSTNQLLQIAISDLCVRKFSPESLMLFGEMGMELRLDYLNRVRMNTISQYQIFSPIPFVEYHPYIVHMNDVKPVESDINRNHGRYDEFNYKNIAFYVRDYNTMRKSAQNSVPIIHSDKEIASILRLKLNRSSSLSLLEMFVSFSNLHVLRAVEPALKIKYQDIECTGYTENVYETCTRSKILRLGQRSQLSRLILDYTTYKSSL